MVQRQHLNLILGKYSLSDGALLWIRRDLRGALGTSKTGNRHLRGSAVAIANDDNLFVGGCLSGSLAYNASNPGTGSQRDMLLLKIDSSNGNVLWSKQHGVGTGASTIVEAVQVDPLTGNAYLGGTTYQGRQAYATVVTRDANVQRKDGEFRRAVVAKTIPPPGGLSSTAAPATWWAGKRAHTRAATTFTVTLEAARRFRRAVSTWRWRVAAHPPVEFSCTFGYMPSTHRRLTLTAKWSGTGTSAPTPTTDSGILYSSSTTQELPQWRGSRFRPGKGLRATCL